MVYHNGFGIFQAQAQFGMVIARPSDGELVPVRLIGEQHVLEDLGRIPTLAQCLEWLPMERWMSKAARRLSAELKLDVTAADAERRAAEAIGELAESTTGVSSIIPNGHRLDIPIR